MKTTNLNKKLATLLIAVTTTIGFFHLATQANAAVFIDATDARRIDDFTGGGGGGNEPDGLGDADRGNANLLAGFFGNNANVEDMVSIFAFEMGGYDSITTIHNANILLSKIDNGIHDQDAFVLRTSASSTINISDYQLAGTKLMDGFAPGGVGTYGLDYNGQLALYDYLDDPGVWVPGEFIFIAIKPGTLPTGNVSPDPNNFANFGSFANNGTTTTYQLLVASAPEPSSLALLLVGGVFLTRSQRKSKLAVDSN